MRLYVNMDDQVIASQPLITGAVSEIALPRSNNVLLEVQFFSGGAIIDPEILTASISKSSVANPTVVFAPNHGMDDGDSVVIAGHTGNPRIINTSARLKLPCTISIAAPGVITTSAHGLAVGDAVQVATTGALPTGLVAGVTYYVTATSLTSNTFTVAATLGGAAITTTGSQSGIHTATLPYAVIFAAAHGLTTADTVDIADHNNTAPLIDGAYAIKVLSVDLFTIPILLELGSSGGTVTRRTSTPDLNGTHAITYVDANNFTVAVNVTHAGLGGSATRTTPIALKWTVKEDAKFDQDPPLAYLATFTKRGTGSATVFRGSVNYFTTGLNTLLGINPPNTANDQPQAACMAELSWGGHDPSKTNWVRHLVRNDLLKDTDSIPIDLGGTGSPEDWPIVLHRYLSINAYTGSNSLAGLSTVSVAVGSVVEFYHSADGYCRFKLMAGTAAQSLPGLVRPTDYDGTTNQKYWISV